jgi:hypothetical protein
MRRPERSSPSRIRRFGAERLHGSLERPSWRSAASGKQRSARRGKRTTSRTHRASRSGGGAGAAYTEVVIYCVIPPELADELYEKMVDYYKDNPNVTVIVDRRVGEDRRRGKAAAEFKDQRETRDRSRARIPGTFPETPTPSE